jgi:hypothetical protein
MAKLTGGTGLSAKEEMGLLTDSVQRGPGLWAAFQLGPKGCPAAFYFILFCSLFFFLCFLFYFKTFSK